MNEPVLVNPGTGDDKRRLLKLAVAGLLAVVLVAYVLPPFLFGGGDDDVPEETSAPFTSAAAPQAAPPDGDVVETVGSFSAKDPFKPVIQDAVADPAAPVADPAAAVVDPPVFEVPAPMAPPAPSAGTPAATTGTTAPPIAGPAPRAVRSFALREVYTDGTGLPAAKVAVDGVEHPVAVGQDFAGSYRVLSLDRSNACGVFLYGDRRFSLCQGEETQT
jgi:hypothetical protein